LSSGSDLGSYVWTADGRRIVSQVSAALIAPTHSPPEPLPVQWKIRIWSVATGEIERDFLGELVANALSPDAKTLAYSDSISSLKLLNLETGEVRSLGSAPGSTQYSVLGWNPSGSKIYVQASEGSTTEVWNLGTLKLEQSLPQTSGYGWNSLGAPADTGVISYAQYEDCSLKILDLSTLKVTRTLDEGKLDSLEMKLLLIATYLNEDQYGITGTATVAGSNFKVRGKGYAGTNGRFLPQTSYLPMGASFDLLDDAAAVVWQLPFVEGPFETQPGGSRILAGLMSTALNPYTSYDNTDGYRLQLKPVP
jgi:WD40 repeat protein